MANINKTGTEEQWNERTSLINDIITMTEASAVIPTINNTNEESPTDNQGARSERDQASSLLVSDTSSEFSSDGVQKQKRRNLIEVELAEKAKMEHEYKLTKLNAESTDKQRLFELCDGRIPEITLLFYH
uniref:Uncharacterized protein n=1 Tax=Strigamia maritima TaxID=126957 RepID=T1JFV7_STRMM